MTRLVAWLVLATALALPDAAAADGQVSVRLAVGGGADLPSEQDARGLFELALRSELLFGPPEVGAFRIGPALDLRAANFETAEAAGGLALLLPVATGFPLTLTAAAGWASRPGDADAPIGVATLAWGYRSYNHHSAYGFGLHLYASSRVDLDDTGHWQITAGVEIDLMFLVAIPAIFVWEWLTEGDPDEP